MKLLRTALKSFFIIFSLSPAFAGEILTSFQNLETSGARDVTPYNIQGTIFLAVPQLAVDIPDTPANMNGGNSDVDVLIYKKEGDKFKVYQRIPSHGSESAEFFTLGKDVYLAIASIRSGSKAPYNMNTYSKIYRWDGLYFYPVQQFSTFAAKNWHAFNQQNRQFLVVANGVYSDEKPVPANLTNSVIYEWDNNQFKEFQTLPTKWGYSSTQFELDGQYYLAMADSINQSILYRWNGQKFEEFQSFKGKGGRAFQYFRIDNKHYLAYANLLQNTTVYQWDGKQFVTYQQLQGQGGRNFAFFTLQDQHYLFVVNYLTGGRENPQTTHQSLLFVWKKDHFVQVQTIITHAGVSANVFESGKDLFLAVANSLSADVRFRIDSVIYKINPPAKQS